MKFALLRMASVCMLGLLSGRAADSSHPAAVEFENSLGIKFVPVRGTGVLFAIWDTRVQDYREFASANSLKPTAPDFEQGLTHPAVNVSWHEAQAFCSWLTQKERRERKITQNQEYRLPTDSEWSSAAGLDEKPDATEKFPWGTQWPPPAGAGNYCDRSYYTKYLKQYNLKPTDFLPDYDDGYADTSPVGSFTPNQFGLYDMGGNVWQWCEDSSGPNGKFRILRGASYGGLDRARLRSDFRNQLTPDTRLPNQGFRCVLASVATKPIEAKRQP